MVLLAPILGGGSIVNLDMLLLRDKYVFSLSGSKPSDSVSRFNSVRDQLGETYADDDIVVQHIYQKCCAL